MKIIYQQAIRLLDQLVFQGRSLSQLGAEIRKSEEPAYLQALIYGVLRHYWQLDEYLALLLEKPLRDKDSDIFLLLLVGLYELGFMDKPDYAVVSEVVKVPAKLRKQWAKNFVNAILRSFLRKREQLDDQLSEEGLYNHPEWFIEKIKQDYPENWQAILTENNQQAPMSIRVNQQFVSRESYLKQLEQSKLPAKQSKLVENGITLDQACDVNRLPGFAEGSCFVQDIAAQLAGELLPLQAEQRVLDACAAPGGKATHLLEREPSIQLIAVDNQKDRVSKIYENLERLKLNATVHCADVSEVDAWWDGQQFDSILLDAPCSATGVIRRHPDIKHLREPEDITELSHVQNEMLEKLWPLLKEGGHLLYVTCSVLDEENESVIERFLQSNPQATCLPIELEGRKQFGVQLLPCNEYDGFYYCLLTK